MKRFDFIVIGAGVAGSGVAAELAADANVLLLEREDQPGYHSTGRSAALFSEIYGNAPVRALSRASRSFLFSPPPEFCSSPLTRPRGTMFIATAEQIGRLDDFAALPDIAPVTRRLDIPDILSICPNFRDDYIAGAVFEPHSVDLEVHELHQGYLRQLKRHEGVLRTNSEVTAIERRGGEWYVRVGAESFVAPAIINAAGGWADQVAGAAGVEALGVQPYRRTALLVDAPAQAEIEHWPLFIDIDEEFYLKPDAGLLLLSPADETPIDACDVQPEEIDIATAVYRVEKAFDLGVRHIKRSWAGLRSFAPDRRPVVGYDGAAEGFFWLAGQGGYGIQTAPAMARVAAHLAQGRAVPDDIAACGVDATDLSPRRFAAQSGCSAAQAA